MKALKRVVIDYKTIKTRTLTEFSEVLSCFIDHSPHISVTLKKVNLFLFDKERRHALRTINMNYSFMTS